MQRRGARSGVSTVKSNAGTDAYHSRTDATITPTKVGMSQVRAPFQQLCSK